MLYLYLNKNHIMYSCIMYNGKITFILINPFLKVGQYPPPPISGILEFL